MPRAWLPGAVGYACLLIGLLDIASAVFPKLRHSRMHTFTGQLPGGTTSLAAVGTMMVGLLLVLLAHALRRRKRRAWRAVCVLLPVGAALHIVRWHQVGPAVVSLAVFAVMLVHQREFYAKADPRTRWRALVNLIVMGAVSVLLGLLIVSTRTKYEIGHPALSERLQHVVYGLFGFEGQSGTTTSGCPTWSPTCSAGWAC